jgi:large subunit ribosomal protein L21
VLYFALLNEVILSKDTLLRAIEGASFCERPGVFMYAIVRTGGKQYRVAEKSIINVEKLEAADGDTVELTEVLLLSDGDNVTIGAPTIAGAKVVATVMGTAKGKKVRGFTYKPTKNIQRHYGHRQWHTALKVTEISDGS